MYTHHPAIGTSYYRLGLFASALLALALVISGCSQISGRPEPPPLPLMATANAEKGARDHAIATALNAARGWGEQNPQVVNVRQEARRSFTEDLQARGEQVLLAGNGDLWIIDLSGAFTPDRMPPGGSVLMCHAMYVVIDAISYEVISVGCK